MLSKNEKSKLLLKMREKSKEKKTRSNIKHYYETLFPKLRNNKPGRDFYAYYTVSMTVIILYIIVFYTDLDRNVIFKDADLSFKIKQFSGEMVILCFLYVFIMIFDRVIYNTLTKKTPTFTKWYYHKKTGDKLSEEDFLKAQLPRGIKHQPTNQNIKSSWDFKDRFTTFRKTSVEIMNPENPILDDYEEIYLQNENSNTALVLKYILTMCMLLFTHIFIFFYLPYRGNYNLNFSVYCNENENLNGFDNSKGGKNTIESDQTIVCNNFNDNPKLIVFYLLHCLYYIFSALQIKYGLLDLKKTSLLMRDTDLVSNAIFKGYKAIPFLYELKLLIDWTFTTTALDLFQWIKLENSHDCLFIAKCYTQTYYNHWLGEKIAKWEKLLFGPTLLIFILACLLGPILFFSSLNPSNEINNVLSGVLKFSVEIKEDDRQMQFNLYESTILQQNTYIPTKEFENLGYDSRIETANFPEDQIQKLVFSDVADNYWNLANPHKEHFKNALLSERAEVSFILIHELDRKLPEDEAHLSKGNSTVPITDMELRWNLGELISVAQSSTLTLNNFYEYALRLTAKEESRSIFQGGRERKSLFLELICPQTSNPSENHSCYFRLRNTKESDEGVLFYAFSDQVSPSIFSYSILTLYLSYILVIGTYLRMFFSHEAEKIIYTEMPESSGLINLCEGIKISRYKQEFKKEEYLYFIMIDLMRSPETLKLLTKSSVTWVNEREKALAQK